MSQPDFLLIGAMKSATTTLAAQLGAQDGIFITDPKEPNYFSDDDVYARGPAWYAGLYAEAPTGALKGDASTHYTKLPTYPDTIARVQAAGLNPKLIYIIRNPVIRARSHYHHNFGRGEVGADVVAEFTAHPEFIDYGCYAMQIAPWIEAFGADAVHLTSQEAIRAEPERVLQEVARFIGHEASVTWLEDKAQENVSAERSRPLPQPFQFLLVDNPVATVLRRSLVPKSLRTAIRDSRKVTEKPNLPDTLREALEVRFAEDHEALVRLFPDNADLALSYPFLDKGGA